MNTWKVILATMVIFGTGVVTGGLLVRHAGSGRDRHSQRSTATVHAAQPSPAGVMRIEFLRRALALDGRPASPAVAPMLGNSVSVTTTDGISASRRSVRQYSSTAASMQLQPSRSSREAYASSVSATSFLEERSTR